MQTTTIESSPNMQNTYPRCINESKSTNRTQALLWSIVAIVLFVIYYQQPDKETSLSSIQIILVVACVCLALYKLLVRGQLTYTPTGSIVKKQTYHFSTALKTDILQCLEEGNTARLKALKNDDSGGLLVELLESQDHLFIAARLLKYEPHGYVAKTDWITMNR